MRSRIATEEEARYDPLTGALNRLGGGVARGARRDAALFIYIDIRSLGGVNDGPYNPVGTRCSSTW